MNYRKFLNCRHAAQPAKPTVWYPNRLYALTRIAFLMLGFTVLIASCNSNKLTPEQEREINERILDSLEDLHKTSLLKQDSEHVADSTMVAQKFQQLMQEQYDLEKKQAEQQSR